MTDKLRQAAQQALEALNIATLGTLTGKWKRGEEAMAALQAALAEPEPAAVKAAWLAGYTEGQKEAWAEQPAEQEPDAHIGWLVRDADGRLDLLTDLQIDSSLVKYERLGKLYTAPQPAKREPLTDAEIDAISDDYRDWTHQIDAFRNFARAIERAHDIGE